MGKSLITIILVFFALVDYSQSSIPHNIQDVKVVYRSNSTSTVVINNKVVVKVYPQLSLTMKDLDDVSKIYFEILNKDSSLVYKADYNVNSGAISSSGNKVFEREGLKIFLSTPNTIDRGLYSYKIYIENKQGNLSEKHFEKNK